MNKKASNILLTSSLVIVSGISIGVSSYFIVQSFQQNETLPPSQAMNDWKDIPESFKNFSIDNSLRIELRMSPSIVGNRGEFFLSSGTAWSWYYESLGNNQWDWYLMTNFHVVNEPIAYLNDLVELNSNDDPIINDYKALENYYANNFKTSLPIGNNDYYFNLSKFNPNKFFQPPIPGNEPYDSLITTNNFYSNKSIGRKNIRSIDIITDFNNDNIDLFSEGNLYNLDMSLIKISLDLNGFYINDEWKKVNSFENYNNMSIEEKSNFVNINSNSSKNISSYKYIAGNPGSYDDIENNPVLTGMIFNTNWHTQNEILTSNDPILSKLHAPYSYSMQTYMNYKLTAGSSGSAVYQIITPYYDSYDKTQIENVNLEKYAPIGIYWGGASIVNNSSFKPSFIQFVAPNIYNIFDNFRNFKSQL